MRVGTHRAVRSVAQDPQGDKNTPYPCWTRPVHGNRRLGRLEYIILILLNNLASFCQIQLGLGTGSRRRRAAAVSWVTRQRGKTRAYP